MAKKANTLVTYTDCVHARLIHCDPDPLLAECRMQPTPMDKFPYQREVARVKRTCPMYTPYPPTTTPTH